MPAPLAQEEVGCPATSWQVLARTHPGAVSFLSTWYWTDGITRELDRKANSQAAPQNYSIRTREGRSLGACGSNGGLPRAVWATGLWSQNLLIL